MAPWKCATVSETVEKKCYDHVQWAITDGVGQHRDWYPDGMTRSEQDVQCALYLNAFNDISDDSHNCTLPPCEGLSVNMSASTDKKVQELCLKPIEETEAAGPSLEWWGWVLIVAASLALIGGVAFALGLFTKKPKKKRAVKAVQPTPVETAAAPLPAYSVAPPIYTYQAAPVYQATQSISVAAPSVITAAPVYATAPVYASTGSVVVPAATSAGPEEI